MGFYIRRSKPRQVTLAKSLHRLTGVHLVHGIDGHTRRCNTPKV